MPRSTRIFLNLGIILLIAAQGCAHHRDSYYPGDLAASRGVRVRAPYVDIQVRGKQRIENEPKLVGYDAEKEKEKRVADKRDRDEDRD